MLGMKDGLFHGPDEDLGCAPANTFKKRSADFGTETNGVSDTLNAVETAMVNGLAALQAEDQAGYTSATETIMKNIIIVYSQATLKYTAKMDNSDSGEKYQAEGYAFWKVMEAYSAQYTDGCQNMNSNYVFMMGDIEASTCDEFSWVEFHQLEKWFAIIVLHIKLLQTMKLNVKVSLHSGLKICMVSRSMIY